MLHSIHTVLHSNSTPRGPSTTVKDLSSSNSGKGQKHRFLRTCPVAGYRSRPQRQLSQHIDYKHPELRSQKRKLLSVAKCVPQSRPPPSRSVGQPTIRQLLGQKVRLSLSPPRNMWRVDFSCPQCEVSLHSKGPHNRVQLVLDVRDTYYLTGEYLHCSKAQGYLCHGTGTTH